MAPIKRKGNAAEEAVTRQPQKRVRVGGAEEGSKDQKKQRKSESTTAPEATELSVLRDDEPSFPRGGGSVLTPLEKKQIHIQATKDVLFEQKRSKKPSDNFADGDDDEDIEMNDADDNATSAKQSRKRKTKSKKRAEQEANEKQGVRIEGLNFKVSSDYLCIITAMQG
jgi:rRNA biogenesis protein RRP5